MAITILAPLPEPPANPSADKILDWAHRLTAWLLFAVQEEDQLEEALSLGGLGLAAKIYGFETVLTGYSPTSPFPFEVLPGPAAPTKRVVISVFISSVSTTADREFRVFKKKAGTEFNIIVGLIDKNNPFVVATNVRITLDDPDESLWLEATTGTEDLHIVGSFVQLD